ncbi:class I SAM-dependent methyltransferase [Candidatus Gracilibacteria bacterium]|nr:class I SAM-dependent methyltransferase [Candidatus Gracilibacteria bacterium]
MKWPEIEYFSSKLSHGSNTKILDIGCGNGRLLQAFCNIDVGNYIGYDLSDELLNEARKEHVGFKFIQGDMLELADKIHQKFDAIFFIASFHHLTNIQERISVLQKAKKLLNKDGKIYMTNWALESSLNAEKYRESRIIGSETDFGSSDYEIKIGNYKRYYHCFHLKELEYIFEQAGFEISENRLFENDKNFISIIQIAKNPYTKS